MSRISPYMPDIGTANYRPDPTQRDGAGNPIGSLYAQATAGGGGNPPLAMNQPRQAAPAVAQPVSAPQVRASGGGSFGGGGGSFGGTYNSQSGNTSQSSATSQAGSGSQQQQYTIPGWQANYQDIMQGLQAGYGNVGGNINAAYGGLSNAVVGGYQGLDDQANQDVATYGQTQQQQLANQYQQAHASQAQNLANRGLSNTTVQSAVDTGLTQSEGLAQANLGQNINQQKLNVLGQFGNQVVGAQNQLGQAQIGASTDLGFRNLSSQQGLGQQYLGGIQQQGINQSSYGNQASSNQNQNTSQSYSGFGSGGGSGYGPGNSGGIVGPISGSGISGQPSINRPFPSGNPQDGITAQNQYGGKGGGGPSFGGGTPSKGGTPIQDPATGEWRTQSAPGTGSYGDQPFVGPPVAGGGSDPNVGTYTDPNTGQVIGPDGNPVDPNSGLGYPPVDPNFGGGIDGMFAAASGAFGDFGYM